MNTDLHTAARMAEHAREFVFPLYRKVDGKAEIHEVVRVSSVGLVPDGRWMAEMGPFYCMADSPDEWVAFAHSLDSDDTLDRNVAERIRWEAFLKEAPSLPWTRPSTRPWPSSAGLRRSGRPPRAQEAAPAHLHGPEVIRQEGL
jgi:hypothetical protein